MQIEGFLEEMVLLCQRSEEYSQFMAAKIGAAAKTGATQADASARETAFRGGAFSMAVRELVSYYMALVSVRVMRLGCLQRSSSSALGSDTYFL